jgi:zinc transport system permease protein
MSTISDFLAYPFIQRALLASIMVGILCPFGIDLSLSSIAVAILIALLIAFLSEKTTLSHDTVIGIAFSGAIATGMLIIGMMKGYRGDIFTFLFGDILAITLSDLFLILMFSILTIAILLTFLKPFLQITFNRDLAQVEGINVRVFEYMLFLIIAIVITVSLKIIGIILVTSLLIVPAASAKNLASSMKHLFIFSCLFGVISGIVGLIVSIYLNTSSGPTIVLVSIGIFFLTILKRAKM